ncbi:hypothetical protein LLE49_19910 [Alicyclobacillus tolerans]|uniref:hypothetical protein n=1 Tax=Alicyclobacillus tolerans TaxID=90970 RepID=UPI001F32CACC|nr:hypothetical protein [Alicyclobacillus tolerans]MCF8566990.1 hypothetical protein [Alicyclobacillus tolerans]
MVLNIVCGLFLPWILGVYLYHKHPLTVLTVAPFASVVSFVINTFGFALEFWSLNPPMRIETLSALPLDIGLYPVLGCWYIILVHRYKRFAFLTVTFALGTTLLEGLGVALGHASYGKRLLESYVVV